MLDFITWTVHPEIFTLMGKEIRWYGLFFAVAFYLGLVITSKMFKDEKVPDAWTDKLFIYIIVATAVGARLGHVFFYAWDYYSQHLDEIWKIWEGGLASHGGAIGIILAVWIYSKRTTHRAMCWTFDRMVISVALAGMFIRLGNLTNHEIFGHVTSLPWGFRFITNWPEINRFGVDPVFTEPSHPTQLYEALCYLATFIVLYKLYWKTSIKHREGFIFGLFLVCIFLSRFLIEFVKNDQEAFEANMLLNMGQLLSIPFVLGGILLMVRAYKRPPVYYDQPRQTVKPPKRKSDFSANVHSKSDNNQ
ncbi:MAG: prolipoprotein diacylglyceryl transferase [Bacteroidales bacterium]|nr:prolipoprotein diacylglyceryl transferase [Bacteroidales bacterium]